HAGDRGVDSIGHRVPMVNSILNLAVSFLASHIECLRGTRGEVIEPRISRSLTNATGQVCIGSFGDNRCSMRRRSHCVRFAIASPVVCAVAHTTGPFASYVAH